MRPRTRALLVACDIASALGTCTPIAEGQDPDSECPDADTCNGTLHCGGGLCVIEAGTPVVCPGAGSCDGFACQPDDGTIEASPSGDLPIVPMSNTAGSALPSSRPGSGVRFETALNFVGKIPTSV